MLSRSLPRLPRRRRDAHKGDFGRVLVIAGSPAMTGAEVLCGEAALRSGAGLVTLAVPRSIHAIVASRVLCETTLPLPSARGGERGFAASAAAGALEAARAATAVAIGPGLGADAAARAFALAVLARIETPHVIDADALNAMAADRRFRAGRLPLGAAPRVLTPHPGEMARLLGVSTRDVQADRESAARRAAALARGVVLLKGHRTVITDGKRVAVNRTGNPGMATGGSGDVLTGIVAALLGQGMVAFDAARLGAHVHGLAGDLAARETGEISLIASDLLRFLPAAFRKLEKR